MSTLTVSTCRPTYPSLPKFKADLRTSPIYLTRRYLSSGNKDAKTDTNQIPVDLVFSDDERDLLKSALVKVKENPYSAYSHFEEHIEHIIASDAVTDRLRNLCEQKRSGNVYEDPYVRMKNCPVDDELPKLSFDSPVIDKRNLKKTYVTEGFLLLYAKLMQQEPIGYINSNDGDIFQDIHPMRRLAQTQSQKALDTIYFHKDSANHFVRPDWVNILGLRASSANEILTSFVKNKDLLEALSTETKDILRQEVFYTPFDDVTTSSENKKLGKAPNHRILGGATDYDFRIFENRTVGLNDQACEAVSEVLEMLHRLKRPLLILKGDFIGSANNECVHNKEVSRIGDPDAQQNRWLMKTVNVKQLDVHQRHIVDGQVRIVNG
jgi:L-asparagine oxygenase